MERGQQIEQAILERIRGLKKTEWRWGQHDRISVLMRNGPKRKEYVPAGLPTTNLKASREEVDAALERLVAAGALAKIENNFMCRYVDPNAPEGMLGMPRA